MFLKILAAFSLLVQSIEAKTALVAGGAGFLGSHLCERLLNEGYDVIAIDNLSSGNWVNLNELEAHAHFKFVEHDVETPYDPEVPVDEIYNLACPASPPFYQKDPLKTIRTNFFGALNLLELSNKYKAKIFQASTSEIYGDPLIHPQTENYWGHVNPVGVRSCYDEGKRIAETLFFDYHRAFKTRIKVARIFNTYGPRMNLDDGRVVSNFMVQALKNEPMTLYGDGSQTRSFCYVDDLIEGIVRFMKTDDSVTGPMNLGNPEEYSMLELAENIRSLTSSSSEFCFKTLPQDDPKKRKPDISYAKETLFWEPAVPLNEGLEKTCHYFSKKLKE